MSDDNQIYVPPSFVELYLPHGQIKARLPKAEIAQRHELCEDLAQMLTETASQMVHERVRLDGRGSRGLILRQGVSVQALSRLTLRTAAPA